MNSKISDKDKKDWEDFLLKNENLPNKDLDVPSEKILKTISCDLHGYSLDDANKKISDLIKHCHKNDINKLVIVTGKGLHSKNEKDPYVSKELGILKYSVREYINNNQELNSLIKENKEANLEDGGSGAFYLFLKKKI